MKNEKCGFDMTAVINNMHVSEYNIHLGAKGAKRLLTTIKRFINDA